MPKRKVEGGTMDYRLKESDYDLLELLQANLKYGLRFTLIVNRLGLSATEIYQGLCKLRKWNLITLLDLDFACYKITSSNEQVIVRTVCCPACKTRRRVHDPNQARTTCPNPDCRTPSGRERTFEILNRDWLERGVKKRINHVDRV